MICIPVVLQKNVNEKESHIIGVYTSSKQYMKILREVEIEFENYIQKEKDFFKDEDDYIYAFYEVSTEEIEEGVTLVHQDFKKTTKDNFAEYVKAEILGII